MAYSTLNPYVKACTRCGSLNELLAFVRFFQGFGDILPVQPVANLPRRDY